MNKVTESSGVCPDMLVNAYLSGNMTISKQIIHLLHILSLKYGYTQIHCHEMLHEVAVSLTILYWSSQRAAACWREAAEPAPTDGYTKTKTR